MAERLTYGATGVDTDIEAKAAKILYEHAKNTWDNREGRLGEIIVPYDDFSGIRYVQVGMLPEGTIFFGNCDGVASKTEIAERAEKFDTLGADLTAMITDDAVLRGVEPVMIKVEVKVNTLGEDESRLHYIDEIGSGYRFTKHAGVTVGNGELAQHNDRMGELDKFKVDISGDVSWFGHESRIVTGYDVSPGDQIVGLREEGLRCNGISLVRRILRDNYGDNWQTHSLNGEDLVELALRPSHIYAKAIVDMTGGYDLDRLPKAKLNAITHVTGGGIPEKLGRTLRPSGFGAIIDDSFEPSPLILHCQELGNVADWDTYKALCMSLGMLCISPDAEAVIEVATNHGIEAKVVGHVIEEPTIRVKSFGHFVPGELLEYPVPA